MNRTLHAALVAVGLALMLGAHPAPAQPSYLLFEGGPVRPVALSPDGSKLFVANAPENHVEIFDVGPTGLLSLAGSVPVGMEPVAVAARTNGEVWVVNHLSDSVSIVDVSASPPRVVRTLLVGDSGRRRAARHRLRGLAPARLHHHRPPWPASQPLVDLRRAGGR